MMRLFLFLFVTALYTPGLAQSLKEETTAESGPKVDGRISARNLYSWDDGENTPSVLIGFLETDVRASKLSPWGTGLVLDATFIGDFTESS